MVRKLLASLLACLFSGMAATIVTQQLAVWTGAGEEFILVFVLVSLLVPVVAVAFFVAQYFDRRALARTAAALAGLVLLCLAALASVAYSQDATRSVWRDDLVLLVSIGLSSVMLIAVHWLTVRAFQR